MIVSPPSLADISSLVELGQICHLESRFARLPYDNERVAQRFAHMIERPASTTFFVSAHDVRGALHGLMIGSIDEYFFCRERIASSVFLLVHPEHRGGLAAIKMVMAFRAWAQSRAAAEVYIGVASGVSMQRTGRFLSKLGLQLSGGNYSSWLPVPVGAVDAAVLH
ncbi:MAG: hypothetical protein V4454_16065 [Pseudomonadota bacterium]